MQTVTSLFHSLAYAVSPVFYKLLFMSLSAILVGGIVLVLRRLFDKKIPPFWKCFFWGIVICSLIIPYRPQSNFTLTTNLSQIEGISFLEEYKHIENQQIDKELTEKEALAFNEYKKGVILKTIIFDNILPLTWFFGMFFGFVFLVSNIFYLSLKIKKHKLDSSGFNTLLFACKKQLGISSDITIIVQDYIKSPALVGLLKPKILLPIYAENISDESLQYIILHELSHYKRKDMMVNYILLMLQAVYWFNPFIWIIFKVIRQDMEVINDSYVLKRIGTQHSKNYARSLVEVLGFSHNISLKSKLLCMVDGEKNLERRISMIKLGETFKKHRVIIAIVCLLTVGVVGSLFLTQPKLMDENQTIQQLIDSIEYENEKISFVIPDSSIPATDWNIMVYGRTQIDGMGMSIHFFEEENNSKSWENGKKYEIEPVNENITELNLDIFMGANEYNIDLFAYIP